MKSLRLASFGVHGQVGEALTPKLVIDFSAAFATFVDGGRVLLARDTRYSSPMLHSAVLSGLMSAGCEVIDLGVCPSPVLQYSVPKLDARGAVSISGMHNPMGWNTVALIGPDGAFLEPVGGEYVLDSFHSGDFLKRDWQGIGSVAPADDVFGPYVEALAARVNVEAIRKKRYTVVIDPVGGAGCPFLQRFADRLGIRWVPINAAPSGYLAREPEPRPRSAVQMASMLPHLKADVGFVLSSDMGRLSLVTNKGEAASEEYTFAVVANHVLSKRKGTVVTNCCTSRTIDDIAALREVPVVKTAVGQAFVVAALGDEEGVVGGEGSGGVVLPDFSLAFDGFVSMALILEAMAENQVTIGELLAALPRYRVVKKRLPCESRLAYRALDVLKENLLAQEGARVDLTDGLRVDWDDGWVYANASKTQKMMRVISEAKSLERAKQRAEDVYRALQHEI